MWCGHDYILIRCLQSRSEIEAMKPTQFAEGSDLLCIVPCQGNFNDYIYYQTNHVGSKLFINQSSVDTIDLAFCNKWGQPLVGLKDFMVELTVDFIKLNTVNRKLTTDDVRNMM